MSPFQGRSTAVLCNLRTLLLLALDPDRHHFPAELTVHRWRLKQDLPVGLGTGITFVASVLIYCLIIRSAFLAILRRSLLQANLDCLGEIGCPEDKLVLAMDLVDDWVHDVALVANRTDFHPL